MSAHRHCSTCGALFAPSEWGDRYCTLHCQLKDMGEPCAELCVTCDHERAAAAVAALHLLAITAHNEAVAAHIEAGLDPQRN